MTAGKLINILARYGLAYGEAFSYANQRGAFGFLYGSFLASVLHLNRV